MLSAIVVSRDTMLPGSGFFKLGQELRQVEPGEDEIAFAVRQIRRVHDHWAGDPKQRNALVAEVIAHASGGHFTVPMTVVSALGQGHDGRLHLVVESADSGERYLDGDVDMRSGTEVYYRRNDPESAGLERIKPNEHLRITASPAGERPSR